MPIDQVHNGHFASLDGAIFAYPKHDRVAAS
jgi:hypothetical protein